MKVCTICKVEKHFNDFNKATKAKDGLDCWCKSCKSTKDKEYRSRHKKQIVESAKWKHKKAKYGINKDDFVDRLNSQDSRCLICSSDISSDPHIDHNHKSGEIRGILCKPCNRGLGFFRDNPGIVQNAYQYLIEKEYYG